MIEVRDLIFRYRNSLPTVLDGVNAVFRNESVSVILGLNGSGKTTLIRLLAGLLQPAHGQILCGDKPLEQMTVRERSRKIAYVAQQFRKTDDCLVMDYLLYGAANRTRFYETPSANESDFVKETAEKLGIDRLLQQKIGEISGGERQIVAIAAAVVQKTKILLLDEPTSSLDIGNQYKVLSVLKELARNDKKTIILSTHNPNHALFLDAVVYPIRGGKIIGAGKAREEITVEKMKRIYGDRVCLSKELEYDEISFGSGG